MSLTTNMHKEEDDLEHEARKTLSNQAFFVVGGKIGSTPSLPYLLAFFL
jgi:hypothetical protein